MRTSGCRAIDFWNQRTDDTLEPVSEDKEYVLMM